MLGRESRAYVTAATSKKISQMLFFISVSWVSDGTTLSGGSKGVLNNSAFEYYTAILNELKSKKQRF
jgi:hypothetical protein